MLLFRNFVGSRSRAWGELFCGGGSGAKRFGRGNGRSGRFQAAQNFREPRGRCPRPDDRRRTDSVGGCGGNPRKQRSMQRGEGRVVGGDRYTDRRQILGRMHPASRGSGWEPESSWGRAFLRRRVRRQTLRAGKRSLRPVSGGAKFSEPRGRCPDDRRRTDSVGG